MRRTESQWQTLICEQAQSGQTATAFCRSRGINPKYFSLRKSKLKNNAQPKGFIKVTQPALLQDFQLSYGDVSLTISASYPPADLAKLMQALRQC